MWFFFWLNDLMLNPARLFWLYLYVCFLFYFVWWLWYFDWVFSHLICVHNDEVWCDVEIKFLGNAEIYLLHFFEINYFWWTQNLFEIYVCDKGPQGLCRWNQYSILNVNMNFQLEPFLRFEMTPCLSRFIKAFKFCNIETGLKILIYLILDDLIQDCAHIPKYISVVAFCNLNLIYCSK